MVLVRTGGEPQAFVPQIAAAVRRADPALALFDVQTMEQRASLSWSKHGFQTALFLIIGAIALLLAVTGVYAVVSYVVTSRTPEFGVRIALGANHAQVTLAAVAPTLKLGLAGGTVGVLGALALGQIMRATLYETSPLDVSVFIVALGVCELR